MCRWHRGKSNSITDGLTKGAMRRTTEPERQGFVLQIMLDVTHFVMNNVEVTRIQTGTHANSTIDQSESMMIVERERNGPDIVVFVHVEGSGMTSHVTIRDLFEDGQIPEVLWHACEIQRDEEFISIAKDSLFGEILIETKFYPSVSNQTKITFRFIAGPRSMPLTWGNGKTSFSRCVIIEPKRSSREQVRMDLGLPKKKNSFTRQMNRNRLIELNDSWIQFGHLLSEVGVNKTM